MIICIYNTLKKMCVRVHVRVCVCVCAFVRACVRAEFRLPKLT